MDRQLQDYERYRKVVQDIFMEIKAAGDMHGSLFGGNAGILLFLQHYGLAFGQDTSADMGALIEQTMDTYSPNASFCGGTSGIYWSYNYLYRSGSLEKEDMEQLCSGDPYFKEQAFAYLEKGNYDFMHGALGIAWYFLYKGDHEDDFFTRFFKGLRDLASTGAANMIPAYLFDELPEKEGEINFGLAHGIPSVLKFCIHCFQQKVNPEQAKGLAYRIIQYLQQHTNEDTALSMFPSAIRKDLHKGRYSRLAWCYGDLGIAYMLYQAARAFQDDSLERYALGVITRTLSRRSPEQTSIQDAGICHGSAGVAHIYHRLWQFTGRADLREATDYWMQRTLDFATHEDGIAGYKRHNPITGEGERVYGLLEGVAGIGLALLGYLTGNLDWDYCFMLND